METTKNHIRMYKVELTADNFVITSDEQRVSHQNIFNVTTTVPAGRTIQIMYIESLICDNSHTAPGPSEDMFPFDNFKFNDTVVSLRGYDKVYPFESDGGVTISFTTTKNPEDYKLIYYYSTNKSIAPEHVGGCHSYVHFEDENDETYKAVYNPRDSAYVFTSTIEASKFFEVTRSDKYKIVCAPLNKIGDIGFLGTNNNVNNNNGFLVTMDGYQSIVEFCKCQTFITPQWYIDYSYGVILKIPIDEPVDNYEYRVLHLNTDQMRKIGAGQQFYFIGNFPQLNRGALSTGIEHNLSLLETAGDEKDDSLYINHSNTYQKLTELSFDQSHFVNENGYKLYQPKLNVGDIIYAGISSDGFLSLYENDQEIKTMPHKVTSTNLSLKLKYENNPETDVINVVLLVHDIMDQQLKRDNFVTLGNFELVSKFMDPLENFDWKTWKPTPVNLLTRSLVPKRLIDVVVKNGKKYITYKISRTTDIVLNCSNAGFYFVPLRDAIVPGNLLFMSKAWFSHFRYAREVPMDYEVEDEYCTCINVNGNIRRWLISTYTSDKGSPFLGDTFCHKVNKGVYMAIEEERFLDL